jgi:alpha-L-fucosidase 2
LSFSGFAIFNRGQFMPRALSILLILNIAAFLQAAPQLTGQAPAPQEPLSLWYRQPAAQWTQALAIGNGRLGAMVFGGIENERLQLNEGTLFAGGPYDPSNPDALAALPIARQLIFEGKYREANTLIGQKMMAKPLRQMPYQTLGDLLLTFPAAASVENYRRDLNLDTAIASTSFTANGTTYKREVFSSAPDQVIVLRLAADKPGQISFTANFKSPQKSTVAAEGNNTLLLAGTNGDANGIKGALNFQARLRIIPDGGDLSADAAGLKLAKANAATLLISAATSYVNYHDVSGDPEARSKTPLLVASGKSFDTLRQDHIADHQRLFHRVSLDLGTSDAVKDPTDQRIKDFGKGNDPQLAALYFQFARYLLISCSRPGGQPATLQGLWNDSMSPPWDSKYTININTEMNYWPAEPTNLAECVEPLVDMVQDLSISGQRTAKTNYGARGWVTHHNTDLWRATAPVDGSFWGMWPTGGAWLSLHLYDHYQYNPDAAYLARIYPILKGASEFFLDTLVEEPSHKWLVTCPSISPENGHPPQNISVCAGPTMDNQIIRDLFSATLDSAKILNLDPDLQTQLAKTRDRLPPNQIGKAGQLQEWLEDWDTTAPDQHHRHVSHLYGLFPSNQIDLRRTPELAAAAKKSLQMRGDDATGWAIAWRLNLWARLHDAEHTYKILTLLIRPDRTYPNMFDAHPPFQIDGNFGGASGITEMLLDSHGGEIELLPALPKTFATGSVKGLRARGGFELDVAWKDGQLTTATLRSTASQTAKLRYGEKTLALPTEKGKSYTLSSALQPQ